MLPVPEVLEVRGCGAVPAFVVLFIERDLAQRGVDQTGQVLGDERQRLLEVDRAGDRLADVGDKLELLGVALRIFVQARRLDGDRELSGGRAECFDLAPVRAALVRTVITDLEHARRPPRGVAPEWHEDADEVLVPASIEDLAREREWRRLLASSALFLADQGREHVAQHHAVRVDDRHLSPGRLHGHAARDHVPVIARGQRPDDDGLPGARYVDEDVALGEQAVLLQSPSRDFLAGVGCCSLDRRRGGGAGRHAHHGGVVLPLVEQIDGGEVEVELRDFGIGEVADHRVDDLVAARARLQHRGRHVAQRAEQPVAVLQLGDQAL